MMCPNAGWWMFGEVRSLGNSCIAESSPWADELVWKSKRISFSGDWGVTAEAFGSGWVNSHPRTGSSSLGSIRKSKVNAEFVDVLRTLVPKSWRTSPF